jgi:hypothetical protein
VFSSHFAITPTGAEAQLPLLIVFRLRTRRLLVRRSTPVLYSVSRTIFRAAGFTNKNMQRRRPYNCSRAARPSLVSRMNRAGPTVNLAVLSNIDKRPSESAARIPFTNGRDGIIFRALRGPDLVCAHSIGQIQEGNPVRRPIDTIEAIFLVYSIGKNL